MNVLLAPFRIVIIFLSVALFGLTGLVLRAVGVSQHRVVYWVNHKWFAPLVCVVCGIRMQIRGQENIRNDRPAIYCANHASLLDIPVICRAFPIPLFFVAKQSLSKVPFLGWFIRATGMIFVDRGNRDKAMASMRRAAGLIQEGKNVITFPEGTRSQDGELQMFKRGSFIIALEGNLPVVPVAVEGTSERLPKKSWILRSGPVTVTIGQPLLSSQQNDTPESLAAQTRQAVADLADSLHA